MKKQMTQFLEMYDFSYNGRLWFIPLRELSEHELAQEEEDK